MYHTILAAIDKTVNQTVHPSVQADHCHWYMVVIERTLLHDLVHTVAQFYHKGAY